MLINQGFSKRKIYTNKVPFFPNGDLTAAYLRPNNLNLQILPNGECFYTEQTDIEQDSVDMIGELSTILKKKREFLFRRYNEGPKKVENINRRIKSVFKNQLGFNERDADFWYKCLEKGDVSLNQILPHWAFISLLTAVTQEKYNPKVQPTVYKWQPDQNNLSFRNIPTKLLDETFTKPPIIVGTIVPVIGWFDDDFSYFEEEALIARQRNGTVANGFLSFPGGKSTGILDLAALRELTEEVGFPRDKYGNIPNNEAYNYYFPGTHELTFVSMIDQAIPTCDPTTGIWGLTRYFSYVFRLHLNREYMYPVRYEETTGKIVPGPEIFYGNDGEGDWEIINLALNHCIYRVPYGEDDFSPIAQAALESTFPSGTFGYKFI